MIVCQSSLMVVSRRSNDKHTQREKETRIRTQLLSNLNWKFKIVAVRILSLQSTFILMCIFFSYILSLPGRRSAYNCLFANVYPNKSSEEFSELMFTMLQKRGIPLTPSDALRCIAVAVSFFGYSVICCVSFCAFLLITFSHSQQLYRFA